MKNNIKIGRKRQHGGRRIKEVVIWEMMTREVKKEEGARVVEKREVERPTKY